MSEQDNDTARESTRESIPESTRESTLEPKAVPLAIIGMGCLFPKANNAQQFWANIRDGVDAITEVPDSHWNPQDYFDADPDAPDMTYARRGGFLDPVDFDPLLYGFSPNNIEATDTTQLLGMVVARQALLDAGYSTSKENKDGRGFDRERTSVILGVTGTLELVIPLGARLGHPIWREALAAAGVDAQTTAEVVQRIAAGYVPWQENSFPGLLGNVAAGRIANRFDLGGTNCVVDAACASSLSAVYMAAMELYSGRADMAISGGLDTFNDIFMYMCFSKTPALSPTGNSKPFDRHADGTILGEGLGTVVLKRLDDAKRDGDKIYAVLKGIGSSSDGRGNAIYAPSANGQIKALRRAYTEAGVTPRSIELVEAHGTGTTVGDAVEIDALSSVYREGQKDGQKEASWCAVGSVKSMIGHTKSAAGMAGMIKVIKALQHKVLPPTIKVKQPLSPLHPGTSPVYINTQKRPWLAKGEHPRRAALSAFGFGGSNFHCVLEEAEQDNTDIEWDGQVLLFSLSAATVEDIQTQLHAIDAAAMWPRLRAIAAKSLQQFDAQQRCRLLFVIKQDTDVTQAMATANHLLSSQKEKQQWSTPDGIWFSRAENVGKLALLFPGQGSQYVNMLLDLACQFPQMQTALAQANASFAECNTDAYLSDLIYPLPAFNKEAEKENEIRLRATQHAQPAIGAVSHGVLAILKSFGLSFSACAGHSFGELTALEAAGRISHKDLNRLANKRGQLMQVDAGDHGAMLAVSASAAVVHDMLESEQLDLVIANHNAPTQVVLSGASDDIAQAETVLTERGIRAKRLPVAAAFHSSYVADAEKPFAEYLQSVEFNQSRNDARNEVFANTTAKVYPADVNDAKQLLASQLARPVEFVSQIENMYAQGIDTFIELGPGNTLTNLVSAILTDQAHQAMAIDASKGKRSGQYDLACLLAGISVAGHSLDLSQWDAAYLDSYDDSEQQAALSIKLSGANYVNERAKREPRQAQLTKTVAAPVPTVPATTAPATTTPEKIAPLPTTPATTTMPPDMTDATQISRTLELTQQSILTLQKMQEQTAQLHRQYLQGQEAAQQSIQQLISQQQQWITAQPVTASMTTAPVTTALTTAVTKAVAPVAVAPVAATPVLTAPKPATQGHDFFARMLLEVVAEKTGYPVDMLSLEMSLDTDLGIDSIKRVEILSVLQEKLPNMSKIQPEQLSTFQVLAHIVEYLASDNDVPLNEEWSATATHSAQSPVAAVGDGELQAVLLAVVAEKTGYPSDMLDPVMNLDTDLGIDSIKRVEILSAFQEKMPAAPAVNPEELASLQTLQQIIDYMAAATVTAVAETARATTDRLAFAETLLELVAEKTGYPLDMLDASMNLDTDLGIDSIKRVEILSAFQEKRPQAPVVNPDDLATLQTLQEIIDYMSAGESTAVSAPALPKQNHFAAALLEVVADKTGYPVDMLDASMNLDTDLGIDSIKRVEILSAFQEKRPQAPAVNPEDLATLQTLQEIIDYMQGAGNANTTTVSQTTIDAASAKTGDDVIYHCPLEVEALSTTSREQLHLGHRATIAITDDGSGLAQQLSKALQQQGLQGEVISVEQALNDTVQGLIILTPEKADSAFVQASFSLLQKASTQQLKLLVGITRQGGTFALHHAATASACSAGISGLIKTADKEWPHTHCKTIDIPLEIDDDLSQRMVTELLTIGPLEVGLTDKQTITLTLKPEAQADFTVGKNPFKQGDVVVVTGGARGVTAEVAIVLAETFAVNLLLLGRSELPGEEEDYLRGLDDEMAIKQAIIAQRAEAKPKLAAVEKDYQSVKSAREIRKNVSRMQATGVSVVYESVDVRDADAVLRCIDKARRELGAISGIIHGAGVLADKLIEEKTPEQFDYVFNTKVAGAQALLQATNADDLKCLVMFSSSTGRFGRKGQADYAAANEVLNKIAQQQQIQRPHCRVLSLNWGPWDGGMVTPQLKHVFEKEGVGVISLQAGARYLMQQLSHDTAAVETVVLGSEPEAVYQMNQDSGVSLSDFKLSFERTLNIKDYPVLGNHVLNGHAVLPAALIAEWLIHGAIHNNPGLAFIGFDHFSILKGVIVENQHDKQLQIMCGKEVNKHGVHHVPVELRSHELLHARAEILLAEQTRTEAGNHLPEVTGDYALSRQEFYNNGQLFHGDLLQGITKVLACSAAGISANVLSAPAPAKWMSQPVRSSWYTDPLFVDSAFQLMILWSFHTSGNGSLPTKVAQYRQFQQRLPKEGVMINVQVLTASQHAASANIEFVDSQQNVLARLSNYECVIDASLNTAFKNNNLTQQESLSS